MPVTPQLVRFGVFELDLTTGELCKNGRRLRLQEQPFRLLNLLLEQPGEAVTRDRLKEALWPSDTFVDFDHSLNAAIAKLRQALGDSAENPRFIETLARRGYRFIAPVEFIGNETVAAPQAIANDHLTQSIQTEENKRVAPIVPRGRRVQLFAWTTAAVALVFLALWFWRRSEPSESELVKLTDDSGLTTNPAISPDGKLLAYASDRGSSGNLNIWIQQLGAGGNSVQLTHHDLDADEPAFSPDGAMIAFSSRKGGGGIYVMPVIGGEASRLTQTGRGPRFSPDGRWIAYSSGGRSYALNPTLRGASAVFTVSASGGEPRRLGSDLLAAASPVWSPDGKHVLVYVPPKQGFAWGQADWWLIAIDGTSSSRTGDFSALKQQGFSLGFDRMPSLSEWESGFVTFTAALGDAINTWRAPVSDNGRLTGPAERLTSGTALETSPTLAFNGGLIFASLNRAFAVWSLPSDPNSGKVAGDLKMITDGAAEMLPSISADGRILAFNAARRKIHANSGAQESGRSGAPPLFPAETAELQIRAKDLSTGRESIVPTVDDPAWRPQISRDGSMLAYTSRKPGPIYAVPVSEGSPKMIVPGDNLFAWSWSLDKRHLLFDKTDARVYSVDLQTGNQKLFLDKPGFSLFQASFSPDDRSVALIGCRNDGSEGCQIFLAPIENGIPAQSDRWIAVDHPSRWDDKPRWSPNGNMLYFVSDRDGYLCLWAQRVAPGEKDLVGKPFPVYHFHNARLAMANVDTGTLEIGVAEDKIVVGLGELTGNIWSLRHNRR